MSENRVLIYSDGGCLGNPGPGGWGAVVYSPGVEPEVLELGGDEPNSTNNRMELKGAIEGLKAAYGITGGDREILVLTDSQYVIQGMEGWIWGWKKKGWKTQTGSDVKNKELWMELDQVSSKLKVKWQHVAGHVGIPGNERVDDIANGYASSKHIDLYEGSKSGYGIDLTPPKPDAKRPTQKKKGKKAFSYLSLVDGIAVRHLSWPECEARVKGRSGAKFKKTLDSEDERSILSEWGVSLTEK